MKFKAGYEPDKTYIVNTEALSDDFIDMEGSESIVDKLKENGLQFPLKVLGTQSIEQKIITGKCQSDSSFSITMNIEKIDSRNTTNGVEKTDTTKNIFKKLVMEAVYHPVKGTTNFSLRGLNIPENFKSVLTKMMESMLNKLNFPEKELKIGDSFDLELPMQIPIPGVEKIEIKIVSTYILEKVEKNDLIFSTKSKMIISQNDPIIKLEATGEGSGSFVYSRINKFLSSDTQDFSMIMKIESNGLFTIIKGSTKSKVHCEVF